MNLAIAIQEYLKARRIWQTFQGRYVLNDEVSRQVRRDTLRCGIAEMYYIGV